MTSRKLDSLHKFDSARKFTSSRKVWSVILACCVLAAGAQFAGPLAPPLMAQEKAAEAKAEQKAPDRWTVDEMMKVKSVGAAQLSPDGKRVAYTVTRAVMEGVAYNNHWLLGYVEKFVKQRLEPIRIVGGGAVSDLWCQIHADVMDRTIEQVVEPLHAQLRGVAVLAGLSLGLVRRDEVRDLVGVARTFEPDPAAREVLDRQYAEFPKLYKAQKAIFRRLNRRRR